jgi:hypothetical protein
MPTEPGRHLAEHARQRHQQTFDRAQQTLIEMADAGQKPTVALVARRAGVSRSWLYTQPALLDQIQRLQQLRANAHTVRQAATRGGCPARGRRTRISVPSRRSRTPSAAA